MKIETLVAGQLGANCYLVIDEITKAAIVIDPGDEAHKIQHEIKSSETDLKYVLLTHGHPDHSFAAGELQQMFNVEVLMHEADVPQLEGLIDLAAMFYDIDQYVKPHLGKFLVDGDILKIGETEFAVIHTPGHTPGGVCFASGDIIFTGDTLFAGSIGRTDLMGGSYEDLIKSIREKLLIFPDKTTIYPGHGVTSSIGLEREENPWIQGE
jgi:glyoxylase-like metal-dependent hydrolase (beta-lactamase superfamily II)